MIIVIHGFGSAGRGGKAMFFREYFKSRGALCLAPSLSYVPELAIDTLEQLIESCGEDVTLIGSSLGGYYAIYLAEKYGLKAVLINPAVDSSETLKRVLEMGGMAKNYYDDTDFVYRANKKGFRIVYYPPSTVDHKVSYSTGGSESLFTIYYNTRNRVYFINKNFTFFYKNISLFYFYITRIIKYFNYSKNKRREMLNAILEVKRMYEH